MPATEAQRRYVERHPDRRKVTLAKWYRKHKKAIKAWRAVYFTPERRAFWNAKYRCVQPRCTFYRLYGGRGIEFRLESPEKMIEEIGLRPGAGYSLDRINNDGHYEPGNIRWATSKQQAANRRSPWVSRKSQKQP